MTKTLMIQEQLREKIRNERLAPGAKILPEFELAREFGVSRNTVRTALAALRDEGLLEGRLRVGTVVASNRYNHTILIVANRREIVSPYGFWTRSLLEELQKQIAALGSQSDLVLTHGCDIDDTAENLRNESSSLLKRCAGIISITAVDHCLFALFQESGMPPWVGDQHCL